MAFHRLTKISFLIISILVLAILIFVFIELTNDAIRIKIKNSDIIFIDSNPNDTEIIKNPFYDLINSNNSNIDSESAEENLYDRNFTWRHFQSRNDESGSYE